MAKILGIGGVFLKSKDVAARRKWYQDKLGLKHNEYNEYVEWRADHAPDERHQSVYACFPEDTDYFQPSAERVMVNFVVDDLDGMLEKLRAEGCVVDDKTEEFEFGKFGWVMDPEGLRIELWQPPVQKVESV